MSQSTLRLTQFQVEKLRCIGGSGRASPYRITTYRGMNLGEVGPVARYGWEAANRPHYENHLVFACTSAWRKVAARFERGRA